MSRSLNTFLKTSIFLSLIQFFVFALHAIPIKVPIERYKGSTDKRNHPGHYPFISYLTFRNMCDIIIDDATERFDPDCVKLGDTIYINVWYLDWFVEHVHDHIPHPYILVSGDVGGWIPHPQLSKLLYDPKLAAWFCRNMVFSYHPKLFQIPMGQDLGLFWLEDPAVSKPLLDTMQSKNYLKKHLLYMCHYPRKFGDRDTVVKLFENQPYCFSRNHSYEPFAFLDRGQFYEEMAQSKFVLSPLGLETDCVRTWEALVLGTIPIVEHTFLDASYDRLPVVMVHDWNEVNEEFLNNKYNELKDRKSDEIFFDYWAHLIKETQDKIRNGNMPSELEFTLFSDQDLNDLEHVIKKNKLSSNLFYKGFLSTLRPFQLANKISSQISLCDHWLDEKMVNDLKAYVKSDSILRNQSQISLISNDNAFLELLPFFQSPTIFLDLTYYRTSLFISFQTCTIDYGNFRQSLKADLTKLYDCLMKNSLVCGNMVNDQYVKEVLDMFAEENHLKYETKGQFWFFKRS